MPRANQFKTMDHYLDIAIVGDFNREQTSHLSTNRAIEDSANILETDINYWWVDSQSIANDPRAELSRFDGIFLTAGPYANARGIIEAVRYAREKNIPFLGTSSGCQFAILEFTKNVLGVQGATHFFTAKDQRGITRKSASGTPKIELEKIYLLNGSIAHQCYPQEIAREASAWRLNIADELLDHLVQKELHPGGMDEAGDIRIFEYKHNTFFVGTLFHPQITSAGALPHPLITQFVRASLRFRHKVQNTAQAMTI